MELTTSH